MYIDELKIENFRALHNVVIPLERFSVLIGENDVGKTSVLHALEIFFAGKKQTNLDCWFKQEKDKNIQIAVTFRDLPDDELKEYRQSDGSIVVHKTFEFEKPPSVTAILDDSDTLKIPKTVSDKWFSSEQFHFIPVHRDLTVQFSMAKKALLGKTLRAAMHQRLSDAEAGESLSQLEDILKTSVSQHRRTLEEFLQEQLHNDALELGFDHLKVDPVEGVGFDVTVSDDRTIGVPIQQRGAGTQNNLIIALFRLVAKLSSKGHLILAMEEPENSLHPKAQRQLLSVIQEISTKTQVIVTTHSPVFIDRSRYESNILLTRTTDGSTKAKTFDALLVDQVRTDLGIRASDALLKGGGNCAILVEGSTEEDGFPVFMEMCGMSEFRLGIAIINMRGSDFDRVKRVAQLLGAYSIPCVVVLDNNAKKTAEDLERMRDGELSHVRKIFCLERGNIEDYYPLEIVADVINQEFSPSKEILASDFDSSLAGKDRLDNFTKVMYEYTGSSSLGLLKRALGGTGSRLIKERKIPLDPELVEIFKTVEKIAEEA